ncbi:MAG: hypothetical protein WAO23_03595 [Dethiobacteria bacterium]
MPKTFEVGGIKVTSHVDKEELNRFVETIPPEKRRDLTDVLVALHEEGLITIEEKEKL